MDGFQLDFALLSEVSKISKLHNPEVSPDIGHTEKLDVILMQTLMVVNGSSSTKQSYMQLAASPGGQQQ